MEISNTTTAQLGQAAQLAVQKQVLDGMRTEGADVVSMMAAAPIGSVNSPTQGRFLDVRV